MSTSSSEPEHIDIGTPIVKNETQLALDQKMKLYEVLLKLDVIARELNGYPKKLASQIHVILSELYAASSDRVHQLTSF